MQHVATVYYFPIDAQGNEVGEPMPIGLLPDGSADLSKLPTDIKMSLASGVTDELKLGRVLPKNGPRFLSALLYASNGYSRFRSNPAKI
jgi:hypothetical protein